MVSKVKVKKNVHLKSEMILNLKNKAAKRFVVFMLSFKLTHPHSTSINKSEKTVLFLDRTFSRTTKTIIVGYKSKVRCMKLSGIMGKLSKSFFPWRDLAY